ncbi:terminase family protein, partial [Stenotrophomonas sp.]
MPTLNEPQAEFLQLPHKFRAFVGGFGSGKTWVGCGSLCQHAWQFPRIPAGYFAPSYPQIRDIFYPTVEEVAFDWGLRAQINQSN